MEIETERIEEKMATACITGASSGIGRALAEQLAARGWSLILVARNQEKLNGIAEKLSSENSIFSPEVFPCDLSRKDECLRLCSHLETVDDLGLLVNNAGFGSVGSFEELDLDRELSMIDLNVAAVQILCRRMIPYMESLGEKTGRIGGVGGGQILNVASVAGLMYGGPYMATYYATKAYVASLTSSIYRELKEKNSTVRISALCPGPVDTNFNKTAGVRFALPGIDPDYCARYALNKLASGKLIIIPGAVRFGLPFYRLLPRKLQMVFTGKGQKKKLG